jgi:hypothetical protein
LPESARCVSIDSGDLDAFAMPDWSQPVDN